MYPQNGSRTKTSGKFSLQPCWKLQRKAVYRGHQGCRQATLQEGGMDMAGQKVWVTRKTEECAGGIWRSLMLPHLSQGQKARCLGFLDFTALLLHSMVTLLDKPSSSGHRPAPLKPQAAHLSGYSPAVHGVGTVQARSQPPR